jgi:cytochrome c5
MDDYQMVHLRLPLGLVKDIDSVASKAGASRNEVVTEAVGRYITGVRMAEQICRACGSLDEKDAPEWTAGGADWVRRIREEEDRGKKNWAT